MVSEGDTVRRRRQEKEGKEKKTTRDPIPSTEKEEVLEQVFHVMMIGPVEQEELAEKLEKLLERETDWVVRVNKGTYWLLMVGSSCWDRTIGGGGWCVAMDLAVSLTGDLGEGRGSSFNYLDPK